MTRAVAAAALALAAGCGQCAAADPPDLYVLERMSDPYEELADLDRMKPAERSVAVLSAVGRELGYRDVPARVLQLRRHEGWIQRLTLLLAHGGTSQLEAAHQDVADSLTEGFHVPKELKYRVRQGESRLGELRADERGEASWRRALLAEIAWALYLVGEITPDAG